MVVPCVAIFTLVTFGTAAAQENVKPDRVLFMAGDGPGRADRDHDDSDWLELPAGSHSEGWSGPAYGNLQRGKVGWYRIHFRDVPDSRETAWVVSAGFLGNLSEAFWNGRALGRFGIEEKGLVIPPPQRTVHAWPVTAAMLDDGGNGSHVLAIRVRQVSGAGGMIGGPVGLIPAIRFDGESARLELGREVLVSVVASFAITWGLIFVLVRCLGDGSQPWVFGAGLFICSGAIHLMNTQLFSAVAEGAAVEPIVFGAALVYWGVPILAPWLIRSFCGAGKSWKEVTVTVAGLFLVILAQVLGDDFFKVIMCYLILLILVGTVAVIQIAQGWKSRRAEVLPVLLGLGGVSVAAAAQISLFWIPWMKQAASVWQPMDFGILFAVSSVGGVFLFRYASSRKRERRYAAMVLESQRHERARIGRHLHDGVAQDLQYLMFAAKQWSSESPASPQAAVVVDGIGTAIREVRRAAEDLQPLALRLGTLKQALEALVQRLNEHHDCEVTLAWGVVPELLDSEEEALFRAASEAALNACRHARAGLVRIEVESIRGVAGVRVIDDGRGFDPDGLNSERLGLRFLRDQAELTGGNLNIESRRGEGTTISFRLKRPDPANPDSKR